MPRRRRTTPARIRANRRIARRHGLATPPLAEPALAGEVDDVARTIERSVAGAELDAHGHALACRVAEAMIDLRRVRLAKLPLTAALHADPANARRPLAELARLDRYERRALSRRNTAAYAFAAAVRDSVGWARRMAPPVGAAKSPEAPCPRGPAEQAILPTLRFRPIRKTSVGLGRT